MPGRPAALELLNGLAPVLERWGRWFVFGAQAVVMHGVPRLSADVHVTLALVPDAPERFAADMRVAGFTLRVNDPEFVRRTRVMPFVHETTGMPLDVVLAASGLEEEFLARAQPMDVGSAIVPVIAVDDLIVAKYPRVGQRISTTPDARALWADPWGDDRREPHSWHPPAARGGVEPERSVPAFDAIVRPAR